MSINTIGCSRCGASTNISSRMVICGAESTWKSTSNLPDVKTQDDLRIWTIDMCNSCLLMHCKRREKINSSIALTFLIVGLLMFLFFPTGSSVLRFHDIDLVAAQANTPFLVQIWGIVFKVFKYFGLVIIAGGAAGLSISGFRYLRSRNVKSSALLPITQQNNAFLSEGFRIIRDMEKQNIEKNISQKFPLPSCKDYEQLSLTDSVKKQLDNKRYMSSRFIVAVGKSYDDLEKLVNPSWGALLTASINAKQERPV